MRGKEHNCTLGVGKIATTHMIVHQLTSSIPLAGSVPPWLLEPAVVVNYICIVGLYNPRALSLVPFSLTRMLH